MLAAGIMIPPGYAPQQPAFAQRPHRPDHHLNARLPRCPRGNQGFVVAVLWIEVRAVVAVIVAEHDDECAHAGMLTMTFRVWSGWLREGHVTRGVVSWLTSSVAGRRSCRLRLRMLPSYRVSLLFSSPWGGMKERLPASPRTIRIGTMPRLILVLMYLYTYTMDVGRECF